MDSEKYTTPKITISAFAGSGFLGSILKFTSPLIDYILGIHRINSIYRNAAQERNSKEDFLAKLIQDLAVQYNIPAGNLNRIPKEGPLIVVANHPYGGLEGIILAKVLSSVRKDVKIMANVGLSVFPELKDFFIFTNPLVTHNPKNIKSIKECRIHLENKGLLLFFPAGKVSYYRKKQKRVTDGDWNRIASHLALDLDIPVLPMFISGHNSSLFLLMGRIYYRFRLLLLPREFAKKKNETIEIRCAYPIPATVLRKKGNSTDVTSFLRMITYALDTTAGNMNKSATDEKPALPGFLPLFARADKNEMTKEILKLPPEQHLADLKNFSVYYGYRNQMENIVNEITILREKTFREFDEGSGHPCDTDVFDSSYAHLFIWDNDKHEVIGAYRMGQTDKIHQRYLSHMFIFGDDFLKKTTPALEMGRSFIVREHQKSFYGLFLLWRGIGEFCVRNPRYRTLYGTVSLSNLYNRRSISIIDRILTSGNSTVRAKAPFKKIIHHEVESYLKNNTLNFKELSLIVRSIESDGKDIPILVKQYMKIGAEFLLNGVDTSFIDTPGLLMTVNLPEAPMSSLKMYLEEGVQKYLEYNDEKNAAIM